MNRRQQWAIRAILAVVAGVLAWRLAAEWEQADLRYEVLASPVEQSETAALGGAREEPVLVEAIAAKNLFSADRNNTLPEPDQEETGPPPELPIVLGTMKLGENYEALMAEDESSRDKVRRVKQGEQIGSYRVAEIRDASVLVEYEGQTTKLEIYQSRSSATERRRPPAALTRPTAPVVVNAGAAPARQPTPARTTTQNQPSAPVRRREIKDPNADPGVRVFIEGNRRRLERKTPFGVQSWTEPLQPGDTQ